jgi:hypothetical protein
MSDDILLIIVGISGVLAANLLPYMWKRLKNYYIQKVEEMKQAGEL